MEFTWLKSCRRGLLIGIYVDLIGKDHLWGGEVRVGLRIGEDAPDFVRAT
jgi:hypothetical protein